MKTSVSVIAASAFWFALTLQTAYADSNPWQMQNLFEPSQAQLDREHQGHVMIYHGMKDSDIDRAMDEQFDRVETMMFTGTISTDEDGQPLHDSVTGAVIVDDDGC